MTSKFKFVEEDTSDHPKLALWLDGEKRIVTKIPNPHSQQDMIGDKVLRYIARSCEVQLGEFKRMLNCHVSREEYHNHVRSVTGR